MPPKKKVVTDVVDAVDAVAVEAKPKSRRTGTASASAAKHKIVAVVTNEGIQGGFQQTESRKPIIVNLPIKSSDELSMLHPPAPEL